MASPEVRRGKRLGAGPADLRDVPLPELPLALVDVHRALESGARTRIWLPTGLDPDLLGLLLLGAGLEGSPRAGRPVQARRLDTLPDYVRPDLTLLVCGLNPSPYAAATGIPFGRPGNRFWPAARRARLLPLERDCRAALQRGVGFTDLVKRVTRRAADLSADEYRAGLARVEAVCVWLRPRALCFVGLEGYRRAVSPRATPGWIPGGLGPCAAYLMPSTSGLNAHESVASLAAHLRRAASPQPPA